MEQVIESLFTPSHADTLKALLNEPFAHAFDHPASNGKSHDVVALIIKMIAMGFQVRHHILQRFPNIR